MASFPVLGDTRRAHLHVRRGQCYYTGDSLNKSLVSPQNLDKPLTKSKTVWQWIITSVIVPVLAVFDDWRVQLAIVLIVAGFAVYAIKRRRDITKVYRDLKLDLEPGT
ncbi:hypothetical protein [uncultured Nitratireductor sp.]|uniref:hypothetical protein n=1 Tax=uncultured Nitratireductor sp. TaxID=520953 RepID=UPI0025E56227|nr:hypothetical protein [uncultured Nitratireductor sp.]